MSDLKKLQPLKWVNDGYTLGYEDEKAVFILGAIPEEIVECEIVSENKKNDFYKVVNVLSSSESRTSSDCEIFLECGGCSFRHIKYSDEIILKKSLLEKELKFHLKEKFIPEIQIFFKKETGYRNNVQLKMKNSKIGFFKLGTNELVELPKTGCKNLSHEMNSYIKNKKFDSPEIKLRIFENKIFQYEKEESKLNFMKLQFLIPPNGFFQINQFMLEDWILKIQNSIGIKQSQILELFSGCGLISLCIAKNTNRLFAYELDKNSVEYGAYNAEKNKISNLKFIQKNLFKDKISEDHLRSDLYIMNPPRNGLGNLVIEQILKYLPKRLFYSSCNYITLTQDLKKLTNFYKIETVEIFDFFPRTPYFESFVILNKIET